MKRDERLMTVLLAPIVSEKSTEVADKHHTAVFKVAPFAGKKDIRDAVEKLFEVKVSSVGVARMRGKIVRTRVRNVVGRRASWKKAYVRLKPGYDINFSELQ